MIGMCYCIAISCPLAKCSMSMCCVFFIYFLLLFFFNQLFLACKFLSGFLVENLCDKTYLIYFTQYISAVKFPDFLTLNVSWETIFPRYVKGAPVSVQNTGAFFHSSVDMASSCLRWRPRYSVTTLLSRLPSLSKAQPCFAEDLCWPMEKSDSNHLS